MFDSMKAALLRLMYAVASSRRLAVGIMAYATLLIFIATLAQKEIGVAAAQEIQASSAAYGRGVAASVRIFAFCVVWARNNFPSPGA